MQNTLNGSDDELPDPFPGSLEDLAAALHSLQQNQARKTEMQKDFVGLMMCVYYEIQAIDPMARFEELEHVMHVIERTLFEVEFAYGFVANTNDDTYEDYVSGLRAATLTGHEIHGSEIMSKLNRILRGIK